MDELKELNEDELIARAKDRERDAFDRIVALYSGRALRVAMSFMNNTEDARDALQEAFIKAYINLGKFRQGSKFYTWFYRVLVNTCKDHLRKRKNQPLSITPDTAEEDPHEKLPDPGCDTRSVCAQREFLEHVDSLACLLPRMQRACFRLRHREGLSVQEIAGVLDCSTATVKVHLFRAVRKMQDNLLKSGLLGE